jgi:putative hemolysin
LEVPVSLTNLPSLGYIFLGVVGLHDLSNLVILAILIALSGLFSGSEVAIMSLSPTDIELLKDDDDESSKVLLYLRTHTKKLLALLLVCNTICNIGIALLLESVLDKFIPSSSYERFSFWLSEVLGFNFLWT